jgi:hypothetical protein
LFFWNSKKGLLKVKPDGVEEWADFESFNSKEILRLEAPYIRRVLTGGSRLGLNEESLTDLLECYRRWLKENRVSKAEEWIVPI